MVAGWAHILMLSAKSQSQRSIRPSVTNLNTAAKVNIRVECWKIGDDDLFLHCVIGEEGDLLSKVSAIRER